MIRSLDPVTDLDAVIALQQRRHFLARGPEQLRNLVNPDSCQMSTSTLYAVGLLRALARLVAVARFAFARDGLATRGSEDLLGGLAPDSRDFR